VAALETAVVAKNATISALTVRAKRAEAQADRAIAALQRERIEASERRAEQAEAKTTAALALLREAARVAVQAKEAADRPAMVASKIDEVQFRRLQEAPSTPGRPSAG
jgi:hypothetical protein